MTCAVKYHPIQFESPNLQVHSGWWPGQCVLYYTRNKTLLLGTSLYKPYCSEVHLLNQPICILGQQCTSLPLSGLKLTCLQLAWRWPLTGHRKAQANFDKRKRKEKGTFSAKKRLKKWGALKLSFSLLPWSIYSAPVEDERQTQFISFFKKDTRSELLNK